MRALEPSPITIRPSTNLIGNRAKPPRRFDPMWNLLPVGTASALEMQNAPKLSGWIRPPEGSDLGCAWGSKKYHDHKKKRPDRWHLPL